MALRELAYQERVLNTLDLYLIGLAEEKKKHDKAAAVAAENPELELDLPDFPMRAWARVADASLLPKSRATIAYSSRLAGDGQRVPNVVFKVPTGGGKTFLACASLSRIFGRYLSTNHGFVLWIVPNEAIYAQTLKALRDRHHPYRQMLDRAAAGRVKILEKGDPLSKAEVEANLCVMLLMLQSSNRQNQETLRLFQDRGDIHGFTPLEGNQAAHKALLEAIPNLSTYDLAGGAQWPMVKDSLGNALRIIRPVVVMDEGHRAISDLAFSTLYGFNPSFVLELSATPKDVRERPATTTRAAIPARTANLLVEVTGRELEREGMIKMPLNIEPLTGDDWRTTLRTSLELLDKLDSKAKAHRADGGQYIRPILLVQVERTGAELRDSGYIHADDVAAWLLAAGLDDEEVALKTADVNQLAGLDLLSPTCRVRAIVTKAALAEGWDCPFAYVLCSLAASGNEGAMTQLVGRILRQPGATKTNVPALDECYVVTHRAETAAVVQAIKTGLSADGLSDLVQDVVLADPSRDPTSVRKVERRQDFSTSHIALPQVLWCSGGEETRLLDAETDLFSAIDWTACDLSGLADSIPMNATAAQRQIIKLRTDKEAGFISDEGEKLEAQAKLDPAYAVRMISDIVPNPFVARELVGRVLARLRERGFDDEKLGRLSSLIVDELRKTLSIWREGQSAALFKQALNEGRIQFRLHGDGRDWVAPDYILTSAPADAPQLNASTGGTLKRSLYLPVYAADLNDDERAVAIYLDDEAAIRWWHRNGVDGNSYAVRGWRRGNVFPDFVFAALNGGDGERVVAIETKGDQLAANLDTEYKRQLLATLSDAFEAGTSAPGTLPLAQKVGDFDAAVVLFSEWKTKLPAMIHGG